MTTRTKKIDEAEPQTEIVVQWPNAVVSTDKADLDLGPPLTQLLRDLGIKGTKNDESSAENYLTAVKGTPVSVSIIEAGATAASKGWAALIAALGGATAIWGAVTDFWKSETAIQGNLVIAAAIVIAACAVGAALIMYGDVTARGRGAAAQYSARAAIATSFLRGATMSVKVVPPATEPQFDTKVRDDLVDIRTEIKETQKQVSGVSDTVQQILKGTSSVSEEMQGAIVTHALAQAGNIDVPVILKTGGSGSAKRLIRTSQGEWRFQLNGRTWMPISQIAAFGNEQNVHTPSAADTQ